MNKGMKLRKLDATIYNNIHYAFTAPWRVHCQPQQDSNRLSNEFNRKHVKIRVTLL